MPWEAKASTFGIAICEYEAHTEHCLPLTLGEMVEIVEESGDWYRGRRLKKGGHLGIFPKSFVQLKECAVGPFGSVTPKEDPVAREVTDVLGEWSDLMRSLFVENEHKTFHDLRDVVSDLIHGRQQILSANLPADKLAELRAKITSKIDWGNRRLSLDLVPRDERGEVVNGDNSSVIDLFKIHKKSVDSGMHASAHGSIRRTRPSSTAVVPVSHHIYFRLETLICSIGEDMEAFFSLYDAEEDAYVSEPYFIRLTKNGMPHNQEIINNMACVFRDVPIHHVGGDSSRPVPRNIYVVCYIIRVGAMDAGRMLKGDPKQERKVASPGIRRPVGCGVVSLQDFFASTSEGTSKDMHMIIHKSDEDSFYQLHENIIKGVGSKFSTLDKAKGAAFSVRLLHGDFRQVQKENPLLFKRSTAIALRRGFPEIIMPGDVRNDLYVTILSGEFEKGKKTTARNIEVTLMVCLDDGSTLNNCILPGAGGTPVTEWQSTIFYHTNSPKWNETVKLRIPIKDFYRAHLKFYFRHASTNEAKDRADKIFCFSFLPLIADGQDAGTIQKDGEHPLPVFKYDKRYDSNNGPPPYLTKSGQLSTSPKEQFRIQTLVCSTKLTQNVALLNLLKWRQNPEQLEDTLREVTYVGGEEIVKFITDIFDQLFAILDSNPDKYGPMVFDPLVDIIGKVLTDKKLVNFRPVLDAYIQKPFTAAMAHKPLVKCLKHYINNSTDESVGTQVRKTMKALEYVFKFIIQSRLLHNRAKPNSSDADFKKELSDLFMAFNRMMQSNNHALVGTQAATLQNFASIFVDMNKIFTMRELSEIAIQFIRSIPYPNEKSISKPKMTFLQNLVQSYVFQDTDGRQHMIETLMQVLAEHLRRRDELERTLDIIGDVLKTLHQTGTDSFSTRQVVLSLLHPVFETAASINRQHSAAGMILACLLAILRLMSAEHYRDFLGSFSGHYDLANFLSLAFNTFTSLVTSNPFPHDWMVMSMVQNDVILSAVQSLSGALVSSFLEGPFFNKELWNSFFRLSVAFLTQENLQLENFSEAKRDKILSKHADRRVPMATEIRIMWNELGTHKISFIPELVGPFTEMSLVPETQLRKEAIPIFFDMMECEVRARNNFQSVETEMIDKLDVLVSNGGGDEEYRDLITSILSELCNKSEMEPISKHGTDFISSIRQLLERLLDFRNVAKSIKSSDHAHRDEMAGCIFNLLRFYQDIKRRNMYIRYVCKLSALHIDAKLYAEAAFTLKLHADLLEWSDEKLPEYSEPDVQQKYPPQTMRERKATIYKNMISLLDKGHAWEKAIPLCKELAAQYEMELFDYPALSAILKQMADFFDKITQGQRDEPSYYRVGYFGTGFPLSVRNKEFIYRARNEHISVFCERIQSQFPQAQLLMKNTQPTEAMLTRPDTCIMICKAQPDPEPNTDRFKGAVVPKSLHMYYKSNDLQRFTYVRPFRKGDKTDNEFETLWTDKTTVWVDFPLPGLLNRACVVRSERIEHSPIENAIKSMNDKNLELEEIIQRHSNDPSLNVNPLTMALNGVIDAAVMGGTDKYREAFFTPTYAQKYPDHSGFVKQLQEDIMKQLDILERGVKVHGMQCPADLKPMQNKLEEQLREMKRRNGVAVDEPPPSASTAQPPSLPSSPPNEPANDAVSIHSQDEKGGLFKRRSTESQKTFLGGLMNRTSSSSMEERASNHSASSSGQPGIQRSMTISQSRPASSPHTPHGRTQSVVQRRPGNVNNPFSPNAGSPASKSASTPTGTPSSNSEVSVSAPMGSVSAPLNPVPPTRQPRPSSSPSTAASPAAHSSPNPFANAAARSTDRQAMRSQSMSAASSASPARPPKKQMSLATTAEESQPPVPPKTSTPMRHGSMDPSATSSPAASSPNPFPGSGSAPPPRPTSKKPNPFNLDGGGSPSATPERRSTHTGAAASASASPAANSNPFPGTPASSAAASAASPAPGGTADGPPVPLKSTPSVRKHPPPPAGGSGEGPPPPRPSKPKPKFDEANQPLPPAPAAASPSTNPFPATNGSAPADSEPPVAAPPPRPPKSTKPAL